MWWTLYGAPPATAIDRGIFHALTVDFRIWRRVVWNSSPYIKTLTAPIGFPSGIPSTPIFKYLNKCRGTEVLSIEPRLLMFLVSHIRIFGTGSTVLQLTLSGGGLWWTLYGAPPATAIDRGIFHALTVDFRIWRRVVWNSSPYIKTLTAPIGFPSGIPSTPIFKYLNKCRGTEVLSIEPRLLMFLVSHIRIFGTGSTVLQLTLSGGGLWWTL